MKYLNFKRPLAVILASLLIFSSVTFVASAQENEEPTTPVITYTFRGGSSEDNGTGDYVVEVLANGGLINTGYVELTYNTDLYSDAVFKFAENIKDASFYWNVENSDGTIGVGFMSAAGLSNEDAGLFADIENPSTNIAYIDADGEDLVKIGTFTFTFEDGNTYETAFTTLKAPTSKVAVADTKVIPHYTDSFSTKKLDAEIEETTMLVFTADDFDVSGTTTTYNGEPQSPTVTSDVADFTLALGEDELEEVTAADTYAIKVVDVSAKEGYYYYDADEIDLGKNFVIARGTDTIDAPVANPAEDVYIKDGFNPQTIKLSSTDWKVTDTDLLDAGEYQINVEFVGKLDENIDYTAGTGVTYDEENDKYTAKIAFEVTKAEGSVPAIVTPDAVPYNSEVAQTVTGYGITLENDWEFVDNTTELSIGENKDIAIKYVPEDVTNYTYEGYDEEHGYVPGTVTVTLNKATGTAPEAPVVVTDDQRRDSLDDVIKASDLVTTVGVWSYTDAELITGNNTITFTYKPADQDVVDYEGLENWNDTSKQFEYEVTVKVLAPYFDPKDIYPPENPAAVNFEEGKTFTAVDFALANGWTYADDSFEITSAGTTEDVKVLYAIPEGYDGLDPKYEYTVENNNIVYYVDLTVNKIPGTVVEPVVPETLIFDGENKNISKYVELATGWSFAEDKTLEYDGVNKIKVQYTADTKNYTWDGYDIEVADSNNGLISKTFDVTFIRKDLDTSIFPPVLVEGTNNKTFVEAGYKYSDFVIATKGWEYDTPDVPITEATTVPAKVKYEIGEDYKIPAGSEWEVEGDYIVANIALTVVKADLPTAAAVATPIDVPYDKNEKTVEVTPNEADYTGLGEISGISYVKVVDEDEIPVVGNPVNAGTYNVVVTFADGTNYNGGTITLEGYLTINKADVKKDVDFTVSDTSHVYDGKVKTVTVTKVNEEIGAPNVEYTGDVVNVGKYTFTVSGDATENYNGYTFEYTNGLEITEATLKAADFKVNADNFTYDGEAKKATVSTELIGVGTISVTFKKNDITENAPTNAGTYDVYVTVAAGDNYEALSETKVGSYTINKATLPTEAFSVERVETVYDGDDKSVVVTTASGYTGLGTASVVYHEGRTDAGEYDVKVMVTEGENYLGTDENGILFENKLYIAQAKGTVTLPDVPETAFVDTIISGKIFESVWSYVGSVTIIEGNNPVTITTTILASNAKNYNYTEDSQTQTYTITPNEETGDLVLTKTYNITGNYATGKLTLNVTTSSAQNGDINEDDVTITIKPEIGEVITLTAGEDFIESGNTITVSEFELNVGKYTVTIKKQRYLAYVVNVTIAEDETEQIAITLLAGDIIGGEEGSEVLGDDVIDIDDFVIALRAFDPELEYETSKVMKAADIDENGVNNVTDLSYIKANFTKTTIDNCTETIE